MNKKQKAPHCASAYDTALRFLAPKARTVREVELKLDEGNYSEGEIMQTIERLCDSGLLNDEGYAHDFVESRLNTKPVSKFRLREQLRGHFVPEDIIESTLAELPDELETANAVEVAAKYMRLLSTVADTTERLKRVYTRLQTRGFSHETIMRALRICAEDADDAEDEDEES